MNKLVFSRIFSVVTLLAASYVLFFPSTSRARTPGDTIMHTEVPAASSANSHENMVRNYYQTAEMRPYSEEAISSFFDDSYQSYPPRKNAPGISGKQSALNLLKNLSVGFPDGKRSFVMMESLSEDRVLVYFTFTGTHSGPFFSYLPTGNQVSFVGVDIFTIKDHKFVANHHVEDVSALLEQLKSK